VGVTLKLVAKEILMAGCKQIPIVGPAVEMVDGIAHSHETLHMQNRLILRLRPSRPAAGTVAAAFQGSAAGTTRGADCPQLPGRARLRAADRQPDLAAPGEFLPG
jgi:hypothetical protein